MEPIARSLSDLSASTLNVLARKSGKWRSSTQPFITVMAMWVWVLIIPGIRILPVQSISLSAVPLYFPPTDTIRSPSTTRSPVTMSRPGFWVRIVAFLNAVIMHPV